jgi:anti-anti-sigma factor
MQSGKILMAEHNGTYIIKFVGDVRLTMCNTIEACLAKVFEKPGFKSIIVDLRETEAIDSTSLGLLAKLSLQAKQKFNLVPTLISTNDDVTRVLLSMGFDQVFMIINEPEEHMHGLQEMPCLAVSEAEAQAKVLEAHQTLVALNQKNRAEFQDLINILQENTVEN